MKLIRKEIWYQVKNPVMEYIHSQAYNPVCEQVDLQDRDEVITRIRFQICNQLDETSAWYG